MTAYALVDGNNFFVSCERAFDPRLENRAMVVLSNNDGCVIARSNEAKALGIQMAQPYFQVKDLVLKHKIATYSANLELYRDIHYRMIALLRQETAHMEVYSIDEAFLGINAKPRGSSLTSHGHALKAKLRQGLGIPVSIGFAPTKTLAKVANYFAKRTPEYQGVLDLCAYDDRALFLKHLPIEDVWGIGRKHAKRLHNKGLKTAYDFIHLPESWVRAHMTIVGLRIHQELRGIPCYDLNENPALKKSRLVSRSFAKPTDNLQELKEAVAFFTARAAEKLRHDKQRAGTIGVFITTKGYGAAPYFKALESSFLANPTANTNTLLKEALAVLEKIYRPGYAFRKAGIVLSNLEGDCAHLNIPWQQHSLWAENRDTCSNDVIHAMDQLNARFGRDCVHFGSLGLTQRWRPTSLFSSPRYTTDINEILLCS